MNICNQQQYVKLFDDIDLLIKKVDRFQEPAFRVGLLYRKTNFPKFNISNDDFLRMMAGLIAYSQQAKAYHVSKLINSDLWEDVFRGFKVLDVLNLNAEEILSKYWIKKSEQFQSGRTITSIRYRGKIDAIIRLAGFLAELESVHKQTFAEYICEKKLPTQILTENDMEDFWRKFDQLQSDLNDKGAPFFNRLTTLCHLLKDLGYDCAKPDSAVMNAAVKLKIVQIKKTWNDSDRRQVVRIMQMYGFCRGVRPPVLDLYFLVHGEQTGAVDLVKKEYFSPL
jgi:3-methyladenine DNA glycosylase Tag